MAFYLILLSFTMVYGDIIPYPMWIRSTENLAEQAGGGGVSGKGVPMIIRGSTIAPRGGWEELASTSLQIE